ncbi:hypothetical protein [Burkholderia cepacia]|uniref:hypothetical protein n=1 Tax=Burkholderia cepacia TaxID=292 RepID=UPI00158F53E5|nr:hypothetical protein [Burkholderia cepacia]MDN7897012.1 hypothetical protein [Burkholderia cepacia]MDO5942632.1 hypothetical protein [Burkholderia cepacia]
MTSSGGARASPAGAMRAAWGASAAAARGGSARIARDPWCRADAWAGAAILRDARS